MIKVNLPDGRVAQFPDGTDRAVIQTTLSNLFNMQPVPTDPDVPFVSAEEAQSLDESNRQYLEQQLAVAQQEQQAAQRRIEGASDTPLENLYEGVQDISSGFIGGLADTATFIASPATKLYEVFTDETLPTARELISRIPGADLSASAVEEAEVSGVLKDIGTTLSLGGAFIPIARDPAKLASVLQDLIGFGMSEAQAVNAVTQAAKRSLGTAEESLMDVTTEAGAVRFADDAALRYDVEQNRSQFYDYEEYVNTALPKYEAEMVKFTERAAKLEGKSEQAYNKLWDNYNKLTAQLEKAKSPEAIATLRNKIDDVEQQIDSFTPAQLDEPIVPPAPVLEGTSAARREFIKQQLRDAGATEEMIRTVVKGQKYRQSRPFEELIEFDNLVNAELFNVTGNKLGGWFRKTGRPVSALVSRIAGRRIGTLFESSFETATRKQELFIGKYLNDESKDALAELSAWADKVNIKAQFLDLRLNGDAGLGLLMKQASDQLSTKANKLFSELVADSRKHQASTGRIYTKEVQKDEAFWASGTGQTVDDTDEIFTAASTTPVREVEGAQQRTRKAAQDMSPEEIAEYNNPILQQIHRIQDEQSLLALAESFRMRPAVGLKDTTNSFFKELQQTIVRQTGNQNLARNVSEYVKATYIGSKTAPNQFFTTMLKQAYGGTLGQFDSAFLQMHDTFISALKNGVRPTLEAMLKSEGKTVQEMGITGTAKNIGEFQAGFDQALGAKAGFWDDAATKYQQASFKLSGFRLGDRVGKGVALRAALNDMRQAAKGGTLEENFKHYATESELSLIRSHLIKGTKLSDMPASVQNIAERIMFSRLGEQQLISAAGRPLNYLQNPNARIFWALTGFAIKQADLLKVGVVDAVKAGEYGKAGAFAARYMLYAGLGYSLVNQARDLPKVLLGDEERAPSLERTLFETAMQPVQVLTLGRLGTPYANQKFSQDPVGYILESLIIPTGLIGNVGKDISRLLTGKEAQYNTLRSIPGGDELQALIKAEQKANNYLVPDLDAPDLEEIKLTP